MNGLYRRRRNHNDLLHFRYQDKDGIWREKSTGTRDRKEAVAFKNQWDEDNKNDRLPTDKAKWTVEQACTRWVDQHVLESVKARANERSYLRQLLKSPIGQKRLKAITLDDLKDYQALRSKTVAARPINLELGILVKVLKQENLWKRGLSEHYRRLKEPEGEIGRALTLEELRILEQAAGSRDSWLVAYCAELLAANSGLRGGEIKRLRLGMIDLDNRRLIVTRKSTKTDAGARMVELNVAALFAVTRLYRRAETLGATVPDGYLLPADLSRHTRPNDPLRGRGFDVTKHQLSWSTAWRSLRKRSAESIRELAEKESRELTPQEKESIRALETLRFHDLRHTFVTLMGERGVPLQILGSMVGHLGPAMVRYYTHISGVAARQAVEMLDEGNSSRFADVFADVGKSADSRASKMLN
ncbi:MAG TPA: tyrosine-type recombinase/integrase [Terriglobales bacterium]|nr:tyrosine-type recombinase/integrase [Terriglobales bacterium]